MARTPIDAVFTWGGGNDPQREMLRAEWAHREGETLHDATSVNRYSDHAELRFALRSIEKYAPFVRKIFVITSGKQRPVWLASGQSRLQVVDDEELFPDRAHLPTFNSQAIECHLHRIDGLAEHFLYLNDDMFFGAGTRAGDFVDAEGRARVFLDRGFASTPDGPSNERDNSYLAAWRTNNQLLNHRFSRQRRPHPVHQCSVHRRATFASLWQDPVFAEAMERTSASRFRRRDNVAPIGLHLYYALHTGAAVLGEISQQLVCLRDDPRHNELWLRRTWANRPTLFCLNDDTRQASAAVWQQLDHFLNSLYPEPSSFEV